ncbi:hypothetical protein F511_19346 [Dorcoceras hygrometricum]|uniref:Proteasome-associated protein ECM29 n=1 Tax=Dorcoceras hygrometricum TaxID=472368 RepID=A0A2Z7CCN4_9LAMI|nr:hypothetical protein F511_19346 [Dorcoceras hygrometricum]
MAESSSTTTPAASTPWASLSGKSEEEREELLDRILTRLALCDDSKLQDLLAKILPLSIAALSSASTGVRNKVLEILSHVNKRVKNQLQIGLPVFDLWKLYVESTSAPMETQMIAPVFLANISKLPPQHQDILLRVTAKVIGDCHSSQITDEIAAKYRILVGSKDCDLFLDFCLHTILYQPSSRSGECPAGLSVIQFERVTGKQPLKIDLLRNRKLGMLNVIEALKLLPEVVYPIYTAACADSQESVLKKGEELLKKYASGVNLDDRDLISRLYLMFNGMDTTSRLKQLGMEFTVWVFKHAKIEQLKLMGPVILTGILKTLDNFPLLNSDATVRDTRSFCFQAIGMLAQRMPQLFRDKIDVAIRLFDALKLEAQNRLIVQEATNSLAVAYQGAPSKVLKDVELLLLQNSQVEQSEVRFCAVRWATSLFDLKHCPSKYICMLASADSKMDIREMALEGLFPGEEQRKTVSQNMSTEYPKLSDMLAYILEQQPAILNSNGLGDVKLIFPSKTYLATIKFLLKCFEGEITRADLVEDSEFLHSVERLCLLLENAMVNEGSVELHATASKAIITLGSKFPQMIAHHYSRKVPWLKQFWSHLDYETREAMGRLLGMASSALPLPSLTELIDEIILSLGGAQKLRFETQHGLLCALGFVTANASLRNPSISDSQLQNILKCLVDIINSDTITLASVAVQAMGHVGICIPLPPLLQDSTAVSIWTILHEKLRKLLSSDDIKAVQKTVIALGHMCVKESSSSHLDTALELIFSLCRSKVEDILFAAGEALSFMWGGVPITIDVILKTNYSSLSMSSNFLMGDMSSSFPRTSLMEFQDDESYHVTVRNTITRKLFDVLLYSNRKEERCSGTVWLLSLTIYCGHHDTIQQLLPDIQEAFSHLIGEQSELTQELASQGKRKRAVKLAEDSEVFQEGGFGESPSGGKMSTYKELCNLANEMGQPDLIYKFMDLANYQASLNSKRGAAFGFSKIAKLAGDALQPYLRALIPRLVRYQYDPDKNVQDAMTHIWRSLVADTKRAIDEHLDLILDDLLIQCGSRLWRSREASCLAIADILQGRRFDQVAKHLKKIWTAAFRAMDDIKETVRTAGDRLCRAVTSLTGRLCDVSLTPEPEAKETMATVLPLLLTEGITSKVESIRKASISMVTRLAKGAGVTVRPYLNDLVCCMLESLSSLEDQGMNYVELHAETVGIQTEKLENLRISIARGSPMWETLEICIDVVDSNSLESLVPRLAQLIRSGVGLNTRVGVANFISLLIQKVGVSVKPFTTLLLRLLLPVVRDEKSTASKRAFANACALVLKYASPSQAQKLIEDTANLHSGDRNDQISCALLLKSYASMAADVLSGYHAIIVPVIFLSRFEDDKIISSLYEELWEENMSSERITLQLYLGEIVTLINEGIMSSSWASKKKACSISSLCFFCLLSSRSASQAIRKLSEVLGEILSSHHNLLLNSLMKELPGRLWEGKDAVLYALSAVCTSCHKSISASNPEAPNAILNLISSACSKKEQKYREAAFSCLEQVIKAFNSPEFFNMVFPLLYQMGNSSAQVKSVQISLANDAKSVKMSVFSSVKELLTKLQHGVTDSQDSLIKNSIYAFIHELFYAISPELLKSIRTINIGQVHIAAGECLLELANQFVVVPPIDLKELNFMSELIDLCEVEKNEHAKSLLSNCVGILRRLEKVGEIQS